MQDVMHDIGPAMKKARRDVASTMKDVIAAFEKDGFDVDTTGDLVAKNRDALDALTTDVLAALGRLHGTLDPSRRRDIARMLSRMLSRVG